MKLKKSQISQFVIMTAAVLFLFMFTFSSYHQVMKVTSTDTMQSEMDCPNLCYTNSTTDWESLVQAAYRFTLSDLGIVLFVTIVLFTFFANNVTTALAQLYHRQHHFLYKLFAPLGEALRRGLIQPRLYA